MIRIGLSAALLGLAATGAVAQDDPRVPFDAPSVDMPSRADGSVRHAASGYVFPARLGAFPVRKKWIIAPDDVMVDYARGGGGAGEPWLSLYVFRRPFGIDKEISDEIEAPLIQQWSAVPLADQPVIRNLSPDVHMRWYSGHRDGDDVVTGYAVVQRGAWFIEVRATSSTRAGQAWFDAMYDAIGRIDWSHLGETAAGERGAAPIRMVSAR